MEVTWNRPGPQRLPRAPEGAVCRHLLLGPGWGRQPGCVPQTRSLVKGLGGRGHVNPQPLLALVPTGQVGAPERRRCWLWGTHTGAGVRGDRTGDRRGRVGG